MERDHTSFLQDWLHSDGRKPLIIRGARQVGKTWLIRDLALREQRRLIEINFEKQPEFKSLFSSNNPNEILLNIAAAGEVKVDPSKSILFLDEIQAAPELLEKLRWFYEERPEMPVVAAGSLLEFALAKHSFSMPVGRISYMYLEPLSFEEFLDAMGHHELRTYVRDYDWKAAIPEAIHGQLMKLVKEYLLVGGMPATAACWAKERDVKAVHQIHVDLLATYRDDFSKYRGRLAIDRLDEVLRSVPCQLGKKFVYKNVNAEIGTAPLKQALDLLCQATVCNRVVSTSANGLPLGAESDEKFSKVIMLDCGLCSASLGLSLDQLQNISELSFINSGGMAEQFVGQQLRAIFPPYMPPATYYWLRKKGTDAEVDYVVQHQTLVLPIEVKAGATGTLKSLHQFMKEKKASMAIRINSDVPRFGPVHVKDSVGTVIEYQLVSLPFYLLGQLHRLIQGAVAK